MLAIDHESIGVGEGRQATRAASGFLDTLNPNDQVALVTVPPPGPNVDFTMDHQLVREHLDRAVGIGSQRPVNPLGGFDDELGMTEAEEIFAGSALGGANCPEDDLQAWPPTWPGTLVRPGKWPGASRSRASGLLAVSDDELPAGAQELRLGA